ncbi:hypothetical protein X777_12724, partial [Ooceraea biroi]
QFLVLFLAVYGTLVPYNDAAGVGRLPGTENLNEKAIPLSRLSATETSRPSSPPPGNKNLAERAQVAGLTQTM